MEFDHIFICVSPGAPEGDALKDFGLTEGASNKHSGQGTANRRFFFRNSFIELLYLEDRDEIQNELTEPTRLYQRLSSKEADVSPFGICFRPSDENRNAPFKSWSYKPAYLPEGLKVDIGEAPVEEPMWFFLAFASRPDQAAQERRQPMEHPVGFREITALRIVVPSEKIYSEPAYRASEVKGLEILEGSEHLVEIGFDNEVCGQTRDFRPGLPLVFRW
ncbi:glyoxalase-like domain protein [Hahella sp. CCB-MM4]|uniref:VOC family protein n=1 Tax=Hahella sp. (strain CCB-MM4) TaxID=1926491 RepID=UPI000B9B8510|nr:VOC family protein [Hahella sp. CCB-MM4]OZG75027.1 glyoxalase-like domain protein [Hahella sp. CCB-MM4]